MNKSLIAKDFIDKKKYDDVIALYSEKEDGYKFNSWDYFYYALAFKKKERYRSAIKIGEQCINDYPEFNMIKGIYCWSIYYEYIKKHNPKNHKEQDLKKL